MDMHDVATGSTYSTEIFEAGINKINICKGLGADKKALHSSFIVLICQDYPIPQEKDMISPILKPLESQGLNITPVMSKYSLIIKLLKHQHSTT